MKKNKFLIYIALFFVIFMLGTTKVKASTYLGCEYTISKKTINDTKVKFKQQEDFKVFLGFINGKYETSFYTQDDGDTYYGEEIEKYITIGSLSSNYSCPEIEVKKTYRNGGWHAFPNKKVLSTNGERKIYFSGGTASCSYTSTDDKEKKQTIDIDYNSKLSFSQIAASPKDVSIFQRTDAAQNYENSNAALIINFYTKLYNKCPKYLYILDDGTFQVTTEAFEISGDKYILDVKDDECIMKDNITYQLSKKFVDSVDIDEIDNYTGEFSREYDVKQRAWEELVRSNSKSFNNCEDYEEIEKKFNDIAHKLNDIGKLSDERLEEIDDLHGTLKSTSITWNIEYGEGEELKCGKIFDDEVMSFLKTVFTWIRIAIPILLIILGMIDFSQVIVSQDPDAMKKCTSKFTKRCIVAIIIFFLPTIIMLILQWINDYVMTTNPDCVSVIKDLNIIVRNIWK